MTSSTVPEASTQEFDQAKNLYVKNFGTEFTQNQLEALFTPFGRIVSAKIMKDEVGKSRGFGFVAYDNRESAQKATGELNGCALNGGRRLFVAQAQRKDEREGELRRQREMQQVNPLLPPPTVFVNNLNVETSDATIKEVFSQYGNVRFVKRPQMNKRAAFVNFGSYEEAIAALELAKGTEIEGQVIDVVVARPQVSPFATPPRTPSPTQSPGAVYNVSPQYAMINPYMPMIPGGYGSPMPMMPYQYAPGMHSPQFWAPSAGMTSPMYPPPMKGSSSPPRQQKLE